MKCTCKCKITISKETQAFKSMQFPELQVTGPSEQHHCLRFWQHRFARPPDREKPGPNCLGFPVRSRPPNCLPRKRRGPFSPPASPAYQQSGLGERTDAVPMPESPFTWLSWGTEAAQPSSVPAGRWLGPGYPCSEGVQSHTWEGSLHRLPNESESHLGPTTSCSAVVMAEG